MTTRLALAVLCVLIAASASTSLWAQSPTPPSDPCLGEDKVVVDVLDPALDSTRKTQSLQAMQLLAAGGCGDAAWVLGNMQRFGPELPGNPLPRNVAGAKALLVQAGLAGVDAAYRDLAELALVDGDARDAMSWTQVWLWLENRDAHATRKGAHGFDADLLGRVTQAWRSAGLDNSLIQPTFATYVEAHGAELLTARRRLTASAAAHPRLTVAKRPRIHFGEIGRLSGYAMFRVEAKPTGEVTRIVVESYGPTAEVVDRLRPVVKDLRLMPFDATEPRTGTFPIVAGISP